MKLENQKKLKVYVIGSSQSEVERMITENTIHQIQLSDQTIALVRQQDNFFAFQSTCPHRSASLLQGSLDGDKIICPLHGYSFDLKSGNILFGSCGGLTTYPAELTTEGLKVSIPAG